MAKFYRMVTITRKNSKPNWYSFKSRREDNLMEFWDNHEDIGSPLNFWEPNQENPYKWILVWAHGKTLNRKGCEKYRDRSPTKGSCFSRFPLHSFK